MFKFKTKIVFNVLYGDFTFPIHVKTFVPACPEDQSLALLI